MSAVNDQGPKFRDIRRSLHFKMIIVFETDDQGHFGCPVSRVSSARAYQKQRITMQFDSIVFAIFFFVFFVLYWSVSRNALRVQNLLLLLSSYLFYAWWDYRFLFLLIFSTLLDFFSGLKIQASSNDTQRRMWLFVSVGINLGFLGRKMKAKTH